jgi:D-xylose transport system ATP-binding protein
VIVLRLGRRVASFDIRTTTPEQVVAAITGAEFGKLMETNGVTQDNDTSEGR